MHKKMLLTIVSVIAIAALAVSPVGAVTDGELDGDGPPMLA